MESIVGLSVAMLGLATLVMAVGAALQAAVGLGLSLFVVPLLALIDVRLIPGPMLLASVALALMMAHRGRAAINRREPTLSLIGLCMGTAIGAWGLSLVAPASLTKSVSARRARVPLPPPHPPSAERRAADEDQRNYGFPRRRSGITFPLSLLRICRRAFRMASAKVADVNGFMISGSLLPSNSNLSV